MVGFVAACAFVAMVVLALIFFLRKEGRLAVISLILAFLSLVTTVYFGIQAHQDSGSATADQPSDFIAVPLTTTPNGATTTLYFGQLGKVLADLDGLVTFSTDPSYRSQHASQCVLTVIATGLEGDEGAIYANGLGQGWTAAEDAPSTSVEASGTLHQQLITPPRQLKAAETLNGNAIVELDGKMLDTSDYALRLQSMRDDDLEWVVGHEPVTCQR